MTHIARKEEKINHMVRLVDQPGAAPYNPASRQQIEQFCEK